MIDMEMTTVSYEELVRQGREAREAADGAQWVEGDLALQVETLAPDERPRDPETGAFIEDEAKALRRYADDIDMNFAQLSECRRVAGAWPHAARAGDVAWQVHRRLAGQPDRFELIRPGMTLREAERIVSRRTAGNTGKPGWNELVGEVGDQLKAADKALDKAEAAIADNIPNKALRAKAERYATWADQLAVRLRVIAADD